MQSGWMTPRQSLAVMVMAALGAGMVPAPAQAQDDTRLRKIEAEIKALQRTVFPGGSGRFFTPEVDTSQPQPQAQPGIPTTSPLTDVLARLEAIEAQLARLTARSEENANELLLLKERVDLHHPPVAVAVTPQPTGLLPAPAVTVGPAPAPAPAPVPATIAAPPPVAAPVVAAGPSPARVEAVQAIAKPVSTDPGDDEYTYGFRLWEAGFLPEARQQLALFTDKYPRHSRTSHGRNLLGRAFLDDGQPREAARYFLENYQSDKNGARAADSLLYLSDAMIAMGDTNRACISLAEFGDTYPALATGRLKDHYERNRSRVTCR